MNENERNGGFVRFDIKELLIELLRWKYIVLGIVAAALVIALLYTQLFCTPMYTATAKVHILDNESAQVNSTEYSISTYLTRDYTILVTERIVLDTVIEKLDLDTTYSQLKNSISTYNPSNSRIIEIYVKNDDPELSMQIANSICSVSQEVMVQLTGSNRVNIVSAADEPLKPSSPNLKANLVYGLLIGIVISGLFVMAMYYKNDKINGADDVQKHLGLCTLGTIPYNQTKNGKPDNRRRAVKS